MEKDEKIKHKVAQTYAEDMAKVIEGDSGGLIKKIIHAEEEHETEKKDLSPESKKNKFFLVISLLFILASLSTLFFFFFRKDASIVSVEKQFTPIIFNDQSSFIEVKGFKKDEIAQTILNEVNATTVKNGGVEGIYLTEDKKVIGLRKFLALIESTLVLNTNLDFVNDNFLMGVVKDSIQNGNDNAVGKNLFILVKIRSIADIFDSLHAWENKIFFDLHGFFGINISSENNYLLTKNFEDGIIENKNSRILYDQNGKIVMMYIFADDHSVIITSTENVAREIMLRLTSSQVKK